jgi:hypothetical protein
MSMKAEAQRAQVVSDRIGPDDPRYAALVGRGFNKRFAGKPDYVRLVHTDRQIEVAHRHLTRTDCDVAGGMLGLATYGGRVNTVTPDATASRNEILS